MNAHYDHLLRKSQATKRGGHDAWAVQSTGEKVAGALVLNRADWLTDMDYSIGSHRPQRTGVGCDHSASCPPAHRGGLKP
jgi:hypothetical protein